MIITLDEHWYIDTAGGSFTLCKWTGKVNELRNGYKARCLDVQIYPPSFESCLKHYVNYKLAEENRTVNLDTYIAEYRALNNAIHKAVAGIDIVLDQPERSSEDA